MPGRTTQVVTVTLALIAVAALSVPAVALGQAEAGGATAPGATIASPAAGGAAAPTPAAGTPGGVAATDVAPTDAGSSTAGAAAADDDPVLLVHGFADTAETPWWEVLEWRLANAGYDRDRVYALSLGAIPLSTVDSPADYGREVCERLREIARKHGSEVDVVAHSMGGLDTRYCVEKLGGAGYVDDLITLGTPHQGTYAAYLGYITPGGRAMVPGSDFLDGLNDGTLAPGVEYTAVWSDWDEAVAPDEYGRIPADHRRSVDEARNVHVENKFHVQLVWDGEVFQRYLRYLD